MIVLMHLTVTAVNMNMRVSMGVLMSMRHIYVTMLVNVRVSVLMSVLQFDSILNHIISADNHHN